MFIILEEARPRRRTPAGTPAGTPAIREVCLVGAASRRYRHVALQEEGLGTQDSRPSPGCRAGGTPPRRETVRPTIA